MTRTEYNAKISKLWNEELSQLAEQEWKPLERLLPLFIPKEPPPSAVVVLGINPSHSKKKDIKDDAAFFRWDGVKDVSDDLDAICKRQLQAHGEKTDGEKTQEAIQYFVSIKKFFTGNGKEQSQVVPEERLWFIDLFPFRHTDSDEVSAFLKARPELKKKLLDYFTELICDIEPTAIVVLNAKASEFFSKLFKAGSCEGYMGPARPQLDMDCITSGQLRLPNGKTVAVFFSGMITNGLDRYSKARLARELRDHLQSPTGRA